MGKKKKLSSPLSTGGIGHHFESHIQASYIALMLTGGYAPCLRSWPIVEVKLQGKIRGFETDDMVVYVENYGGSERQKLLAQIKHKISITKNDSVFGEVVQSAWSDFNNPDIFINGKDVLALITTPLSAIDSRCIDWILGQARHTKDVGEFLTNVQYANFSPSKAREKLAAIRFHVNRAGGGEVADDQFYDFLNHFYILGYDLGREVGVVLSLLHSHLSQFDHSNSKWAWGRIVDVVQTWNHDAGTVVKEKLPKDLIEAFSLKSIMRMPKELDLSSVRRTVVLGGKDSTYLSLVALLGSWDEKNKRDMDIVANFLRLEYEEWVGLAAELLDVTGSPLLLKNGVWSVEDKVALLEEVGAKILNAKIDIFRDIAIGVLSEKDPSFDLPKEQRYVASIYGKVKKHSSSLRIGISEGLAILGSNSNLFSNLSAGKGKNIASVVLVDILREADWMLWGSLDSLLPNLAESAPDQFLELADSAMRQSPCPFEVLFDQEGTALSGSNYISGLLWAVERLAWDEEYLVRACMFLGELSSKDPGGNWINRPINSLVAILLPWMPQTLASFEKRKSVVKVLIAEWPDVAWKILLKFLPNQTVSTSGTNKPKWRRVIPDDWERGVTREEYREQILFYAEQVLDLAGIDALRLSELVGDLSKFPKELIGRLVDRLSSEEVLDLPEEDRQILWEGLLKMINRHKRFSDQEWSLSEKQVDEFEKAASVLMPQNFTYLYQHLFSSRDMDLYDNNGDWENQQRLLSNERSEAVRNIICSNGLDGILQLVNVVDSPDKVGFAVGSLNEDNLDIGIFPDLISSEENSVCRFVRGYVLGRFRLGSWDWCDSIDKNQWTSEQIAFLLTCLPFAENTWVRAAEWLADKEEKYWSLTSANSWPESDDVNYAVQKLLEFDRPFSALNCLNSQLFSKQELDKNLAIQVLLATFETTESGGTIDSHDIVEVIKYLQSSPSGIEEELVKVEWAYLSFLTHEDNAPPLILERTVSKDPNFFLDLIKLAYKSTNEIDRSQKARTHSEEMSSKAWQILRECKIIPGMVADKGFDPELFNSWLHDARDGAKESGHLEVALITVGEILFNTPNDLSGLWINKHVAKAINGSDGEYLRRGYQTAAYNSRGAHWVDPTGKPEKELALHYREKAESLEKEGLGRFAVVLRNLASGYEAEAERIVKEHEKD